MRFLLIAALVLTIWILSGITYEYFDEGPVEFPETCTCAGKPEGCQNHRMYIDMERPVVANCAIWPGGDSCCVVIPGPPALSSNEKGPV